MIAESRRRCARAACIAIAVVITSALPVIAADAVSRAPLVSPATPRRMPPNYKLAPDDEVSIRVNELDEYSNLTVRVDTEGNLHLPLAGRIHAAGLTVRELEAQVRKALDRYLQDPEVFVALTEFRSQPISVLGAVRNPGVHQLDGHKSLYEVLSLAGGLADDAGYRVTITRRLEWGRLPLTGAHDDGSGSFSVASINVRGIVDGSRPQDNIEIRPEDVISVPRAEMIYVVGAVTKSGAFTLGEHETLSALQVVSLAEGMATAAQPNHSRILRSTGGTRRTEIPIDLRGILEHRLPDVQLQANDILFVPTSKTRNATMRALETALQMGTGIVIYRR